MTVAAVLLVKNEADVIGAALDYAETQVDEILAVDNGSTDGTLEILRERGALFAVEDGYRYSEIVSGLVAEAGRRGHAWAVPWDADEAWAAPERERLGDWLASIPDEYGAASGFHLNHVEAVEDASGDPDPFRRLPYRLAVPGWAKVAVRALPGAAVSWGAHAAIVPGREGIVGGVDVHHFAWRSPEQAVAKIRRGIEAHALLPANRNDEHWTRWRDRPDSAIVAWYLAECRLPVADLVRDPVYP